MFEQKKHLATPKTDLSVNDEPDNLPEFSPITPPPRHDRRVFHVLIGALSAVLIAIIIFIFYQLIPRSSDDTGLIYTSPSDLSLDTKNWLYDTDSDIYYQLGVVYTKKPVDNKYNSLGIFVPGKFLNCTENGDKYTCTKNEDAEINSYTAATAPVLFPVDAPEYSAKSTPTTVTADAKLYTAKGFIYVEAGMRGLDIKKANYETAAPWGVTDAKAALRYIRYNSDKLPGDMDKTFAFGLANPGSLIIGTSGDSPLYTPYLDAIGALQTDQNGNPLSDAIFAVSSWSPVTSLEAANSAYEWNLGQYSTSGTRAPGKWTKQLSNDLALAFPEYLNGLGLKSGTTDLVLAPSAAGTYTSGTYYDYLVNLINASLNNYLRDNFADPASRKAYVDSLNTDKVWVTYKKDVARISSLADFVTHQKQPTKSVGAFDAPDRSALENSLFALKRSGEESKHFDRTLTALLKNNASQYSVLSNYDPSTISATSDLAEVDSQNSPASVRLDMYSPMYFILNSINRPDEQSSAIAKNWRLRSGLTQSDTALTTEVNLALTLKMNQVRTAADAKNHVSTVDFATVWGQGHTEAERTGTAPENFSNWVESLTK